MSVVTRHAGRAALAPWRALSWSLLIVPLSAVFVLLALVFAAEWLYADRTLPGVSVGGVEVSSLTRQATVERLEAEIARPWSESAVVASYEARTWRTTNGAIGLRPDVAAAADAALAYGKTGSLLDRAYAWAGALRGDVRLPLAFRTDADALEKWVASVAAEIDRPAVSGSIAVGPKSLIVAEPSIGAELDRRAALRGVLAATSLGDRRIDLAVRRVYPAVDESGFREALSRARAMVAPLAMTVEDRRVDEDPAGLATLVVVERVAAKPGELPAIPAEAIAPAQRYRFAVSPNDALVGQWATALAAKLDRPGVNARFTVTATGTLGVVPGITGIRIDQERLRAVLMEELLQPVPGVREIVPPTIADPTAFTTAQAKEWLPKLVRTSSFTTYFPANKSRHANIATGSSQFDGVVLLPGQTFSFWDLLGPVTTERGYAYAGAIINNRSDDSVIGGGLCQVSTTIFNAVAKLGYEIVERHPHGYLIERYPLGLDAAVFLPGSDLRWRNDTSSPVFLWSWVGDTFVTFDVWGLPTGRTVTFSTPVQRNFVDIPKDQPADPAFPAGYSVKGRDVIVTRTVTENGTVLHQDALFSHYAPVWGGPAPEEPAPTTR